LTAARLAIPEWDGFEDDAGTGTVEVTRTTALVSVYSRVLDSPLDSADEEIIGEWFSRRLDEVLGLLNDYLVILASVDDEWHISRISRADLPRRAPYLVDIRPAREASVRVSSMLDVHARIRDDLPAEREPEEASAVTDLIHAYREGRAPFFDWTQYMQAAEHHLGSGRYEQAVIAAATATEVMVNIFFREVWEALELDAARLAGVLDCGFKNQLVDQLPKFLTEAVDLADEDVPPGRWYRGCYLVRNRVVHEGYRPTSAEAWDATVAARAFAAWIGRSMKENQRTTQIAMILQTPLIMRRP
jgi:hypothetical protein